MKRMNGFEHGVNLGGWMSHENYAIEHLESFIHEEDVEHIASWGLDHVRIPIDYNLFEKTEDVDPIGFIYLEKGIAWCLKYGLNVVIDLHKTAGFSYEAMYNESGFFDEESYQNRFYALWETFATRYGNQPEHIAFELLNEVTEPSYMPSWNRIATETIRRVRAIAPDTWILVGSYWNNAVEALPGLDLPHDERLVYNFHCYEPILCTHQGAHWIPEMPKDFRIPYPVTMADYAQAHEKVLGGWTRELEEGMEAYSAAFFKKRFEDAVKLAEEKDVALYCGEYGVIDLASDETVLNWYKDIHEAFETLGIARAAWSYKQMDFGIIDRPSIEKELIDLL